MRHSLTEKNVDTRRGTCSVDGEVRIQKSGTGWVCGEKHNAAARASKARNPERDRGSKTEHPLGWHDGELRTGECRKCGPVEIVPNGRGYMCATRAKELGRVNHQDAPQTSCRDCWAEMEGDADRYRVWLRADGVCPRCSTGQDLHAGLRQQEDVQHQMAELEPGFHLVGGDPYAMPEYESAVPGWKTLP